MARKIPAMRSHALAYRLGLTMFVVMPILAGLKSIRLPANITVVVPVLLLATLASARSWQRIKHASIADQSLLALCAWMLVYAAVGSNVIANLPADYGLHLASLILLCPLAYYCGRIACQSIEVRDGARLLQMNAAIVLVFTGFKLAFPTFVASSLGETGSYYQYMGDGLAVAALIAYGIGYRPRLYWAYFLTLALLLAIGSRASALAFGLGLLFTNRRLFILFIATSIPVAALVMFMVERGIGGELFGQFRVLSTVLSLYLDDTVDLSLLERQEFLSNAFQVIWQHPLFGLIAYEARAGSLGEYAHNILHMWANFGLIGFLLTLLVLFGAPLERIFGKRLDVSALFDPKPLLVFCAAELLLFRHPENLVLFYALGAMVSLYKSSSDRIALPRNHHSTSTPIATAATNPATRA